jgi:hypothetical protein
MVLKERKIQVKVEVRKVPKIGALVAGHLFSAFAVIRESGTPSEVHRSCSQQRDSSTFVALGTRFPRVMIGRRLESAQILPEP